MSGQPEPMNAYTKAAVLKALLDAVKAEYETARRHADEQLAGAWAHDGVCKVAVRLPGGAQVASLSVAEGKTSLAVSDAQLLAWVKARHPSEVVTSETIRPAFVKSLLAQLAVSDADDVVYTGTGEVVDWAQAGPPGLARTTMSFAAGGRDEVLAALRDGHLDVPRLRSLGGRQEEK